MRHGNDQRPAPTRVVVTGAAGFIGSHLVEALLTNGNTVVGVDRRAPDGDPATTARLSRALKHPRFSLVTADLRTFPLTALFRHSHAVFHLATTCPSSQDVVRLIDGTKVICGTSTATVRHSNLFGYAGYGYDKSHSMYFWGCKLLLEVTADGLVTGFVLVNPKLVDERRAVLLMQEHPYTTMPHGSTAVGDKGFRSKPFEAELLAQGVVLVRPTMKKEHDPGVFPKWFRNRVESVIDTLKGQLGIEHPGAHEPSGLFARVVQRILALNAAIWHNWTTEAAVKRSLTAYDH